MDEPEYSVGGTPDAPELVEEQGMTVKATGEAFDRYMDWVSRTWDVDKLVTKYVLAMLGMPEKLGRPAIVPHREDHSDRGLCGLETSDYCEYCDEDNYDPHNRIVHIFRCETCNNPLLRGGVVMNNNLRCSVQCLGWWEKDKKRNPDSNLRKLERAHRASPDDVTKRKRYIDALRRAGKTYEEYDYNYYDFCDGCDKDVARKDYTLHQTKWGRKLCSECWKAGEAANRRHRGLRRWNPRRKSDADTKKAWQIGQQIHNLRSAMGLTIHEFSKLVTKHALHPRAAYMLEKALPHYELGGRRCNTVTLKRMSNLAKRHGIPFRIQRDWIGKAAQETYKDLFNKKGYLKNPSLQRNPSKPCKSCGEPIWGRASTCPVCKLNKARDETGKVRQAWYDYQNRIVPTNIEKRILELCWDFSLSYIRIAETLLAENNFEISRQQISQICREAKIRQRSGGGATWQPSDDFDDSDFDFFRARRNPKRRYTDEQNAEVLRLCAETELSYSEIARLTGVAYQAVRKKCIKAGTRSIHSPPVFHYHYTDEQKAQKVEVLRLCTETELSYTEIAQLTGVGYQTVRRWCLRAGSRYVTRYTDEQKAEVLRLCAETELPYTEIAQQTGVDSQAARKWCLQAGSRYATYYTDEQKAEVLRLCVETELSYAEITRRTGVLKETVRSWCLKAGSRGND
jgi:transposase-like protein